MPTARYRTALDAGTDPAVVAGWIAETQAERRLAEQSATATPAVTKTENRLSQEEIVAIVEELVDMVTAVRDAEPEHKLDVYRNVGLRLTEVPPVAV